MTRCGRSSRDLEPLQLRTVEGGSPVPPRLVSSCGSLAERHVMSQRPSRIGALINNLNRVVGYIVLEVTRIKIRNSQNLNYSIQAPALCRVDP